MFNSNVIVLAAGKTQIPVLQRLTRLPVNVIGVDVNPEAEGFALCSEVIVNSTHDPRGILKQLKERFLTDNIKAIINRSSGIPVITAAHLCQALSIKGVQINSAETVVNKEKFIAFCHKNGLNAADFKIADINSVPDSAPFLPCVVKPSLSFKGKSGVTFVSDNRAFKSAIELAFEHSQNGKINIEEYVEGYDVSLISIVKNRKFIPFILLDEINRRDEHGHFYGRGFASPSSFTGTKQEEAVVELARQCAEKLDLHTTAFLVSMKIKENGKPALIEIHLDLGGDLIFEKLMPQSASRDLLFIIIKVLADLENSPEMEIFYRPAALLFGRQNGQADFNNTVVLRKATLKELKREIEQQLGEPF
jgi:formate-dependent phosphoribosylglycinamide formyltransferase (GAR transformylase)